MKQFHPRNGRVIAHCDCNAFFASCEIANDSSLENKAVVVAGNLKRSGVVVAANYIAKAFGIYTTMSMWQARQKCPDLVVKAPDFDLYKKISVDIFTFLSGITEEIEVASIDECYLDITELARQGKDPIQLATSAQQDIFNMFRIQTSWGIGPCKVLSKHGSDWKKPMGLTVIRRRDVPNMLWPKPVYELHGCGSKTAEKLADIDVLTIGDLANAEENKVKDLLGKNGVMLRNWANGIDDRPVNKDRATLFKSIGNSTTLPYNTAEERILVETLEALANSVSRRMTRKNVMTYTIQITIRYNDFKTITRSQTIVNPIFESMDVFRCAAELFKKNWSGDSVRLLGISAQHVVNRKEAAKQLDLFHFEEEAIEVERKEPLDKTIAALKEKFGDTVIQTGADLHQTREKSVAEKLTLRFDSKK